MLKGWNSRVRMTRAISSAWTTTLIVSKTPPSSLAVLLLLSTSLATRALLELRSSARSSRLSRLRQRARAVRGDDAARWRIHDWNDLNPRKWRKMGREYGLRQVDDIVFRE